MLPSCFFTFDPWWSSDIFLNIHNNVFVPYVLTSCGSSWSYLRMEDMNCRCLLCSSRVTTSCSLSCSRCWAPANSSLNHWFSWQRRRTWEGRKERMRSKKLGGGKQEKRRNEKRNVGVGVYECGVMWTKGWSGWTKTKHRKTSREANVNTNSSQRKVTAFFLHLSHLSSQLLFLCLQWTEMSRQRNHHLEGGKKKKKASEL